MKIRAIRGKNLASLHGKFELRLDQPPVSSFGLFSISGPTGSGKSTLLDALCLALYGKTPRLTDDGGHVIGAPGEDEKLCLKSNDVRAILSRGTADGYAEVEFEGVDGRVYVAKWQVRRAREKATGRFQQQAMELRAADSDEVLASQLSATCDEIKRRVGFTYEEFKRTVLLPQFEFTNFLKAKPDERAKILERVTGGEIFTKLSMAAHARASTESAHVAELEQRLANTAVLSAEQREQLTAQLGKAEEQLGVARNQAKQAERDLAWHRDHAQQLAKLEEAKQALEQAERQLKEAEPMAKELAAVIAVQPYRVVLNDAVESARLFAEAKDAVVTADEQLLKANDAAKQASDLLQISDANLTAAREQASALQPQIEEAKRLDLAIQNVKTQANAAAEKLARAARDLGATKEERNQCDEGMKVVRADINASETWLAAHAAEQILTNQWTRWQAELRRHADTVSRLAGVADRLGTATLEAQRLRQAATDVERVVAERQSALTAAEAALAAASARVDLQDLGALRDRSAQARQRALALSTLAQIAERAREASGQEALLATSVGEGTAMTERLSAYLVRYAGDRDSCKTRLSEARLALRAAEAALSLADHRAALRDGQPCPLCGSVEHPWAHGEVGQSVVEPLIARIHELEGAEAALTTEVRNAEAQRAATENALTRARADLENAVAAAQRAQHEYEALRTEFATLPARADEAPSAIAALLDDAQPAVRQAEDAEAAALAQLDQRNRAQLALNSARDQASLAAAEQSRIKADLDRKDNLVAQLDEELRRLTHERDGMETALTPALCWRANWTDEARRDAPTFARVVEQQVSECADWQRKLESARRELQDLQAKIETTTALIAEREGHHAEAQSEHQGLRAALDELAAHRSLVLGGRDAELVTREVAGAVETAARAQDNARGAREKAATWVAAQQATRDKAFALLADCERRAAEAESVLNVTLAKLAIDRATLAQRLDRDPAWITEASARMDELRNAITRIAATVGERHNQLIEKQAQDRPTRDPAACQAALDEAQSTEANRQAEVLDLRGRIRQDDAQRLARQQLEAEARAQADKARVWSQLDDLIGSADGKKFRVFAQGLAFKALVRQANLHLADLSPRYRLMAVPGADLELQVADQDLGGEVRSVNSLSGGETFLVSLSLALGLSALSTRATQAQTLFIDEGFGTLDRDTLDHAMVALENLQATGRTVGIISHVPELHERFGAQVRVERVGVGRSRLVTGT